MYLYIYTISMKPQPWTATSPLAGDWTFPPEPKPEVVLASSSRTFSYPHLGHCHRPSAEARREVDQRSCRPTEHVRYRFFPKGPYLTVPLHHFFGSS